jgi:hypothetical protein
MCQTGAIRRPGEAVFGGFWPICAIQKFAMGLKLQPKVPHGIYDVMGVLVQFLDLSRAQFVRKRGEK